MGAECSTYGGEDRCIQNFGRGDLREVYHSEDLGLDGRIILRWIFRKWLVGYGLDQAGSGQGQVAGTCECGNESSGSIKRGEFLDWLRTGQLIRKDSAPRSKHGVCARANSS